MKTIPRWVTLLLATSVLILGLSMPSLTFYIQDQRISNQLTAQRLVARPSERDSLHICHMLRMAYITDKQTILSTGKYLTAEEAFMQAQVSLHGLQSLDFLSVNWENCTLQDYAIVFRISSEDLSRRMIMWSLIIETEDGAVMHLTLDDKTGMVLGFSYNNVNRPFHTSPIPPAESQIYAQTLMDLFADYWGVDITNTSIISDSGGYMLTVTEGKDGISAEIPFLLDQNGFRINISG